MALSDPSQNQLLALLSLQKGQCLWLADENASDVAGFLQHYSSRLHFMSNRFDVFQLAQQRGLEASFSDWDFSALPSFSAVFLRLCKEKDINHHLIREAHTHLDQNGILYIAGEKNEGIKSHWEFAAHYFDSNEKLKKHGNAYVGGLTKKSHTAPQEALTTEISSYHEVREIGEWEGQPILSKPGVYGWDKIDVGSALLIEQLKSRPDLWENAEHVLDLGCGYGFLSFASPWIPCSMRVATDNNAAALMCCQQNADIRRLPLEVIAADKGNSIDEKFDLILCNPPFHKGFNVNGDLTREFLVAAQKKLFPKGTAVFVVNSFIPIEKKLDGLFKRTELLCNTGQFKVLALGLS